MEIVPLNLGETVDFYTGILGFKIRERRRVERPPMEELVFLELGDTVVELLGLKNPIPPSSEPLQAGYRRLAIEVEDMDKAVEHLKSKGVEITLGPAALGKSKRAEIKDPNGLSIELRQW